MTPRTPQTPRTHETPRMGTPRSRPRGRRVLAGAAALAALATIATTASCGTSGTSGGAAGAGGAGEKVQVVVGFYPLQYAVERVGGSHVAVTNLTKPGAEPHDLELTPQDVAKVGSAALAVYEKGLQPAVDKAIAEQGAKGAYDVSGDADLTLGDPAAKVGGSGDGGSSGGASSNGMGGSAAKDPHFWLDPVRYAKVATALAAKLGEVDAAHRADYEKNAKTLAAELTTLDKDFSTGLATCTSRNLVTSHAAFGYLADRYKLVQRPIAGLSPDAEPDAARLGEIAAFVKANKVTTIYTETLASPAVAQTVARETGAQTAVLDPLEGITDASAAKDYPGVMRANLATLKKGQSCS